MDGFLGYLEKNAAFLAQHWFTCLVMAVIGGGLVRWYDGQELDRRQDTINRYRVALGIDAGSQGALVELTNAELKAKAFNIVGKIRVLSQELTRRMSDVVAMRAAGKIDDKSLADAKMAALRDVSAEFERGLRADAINMDSELRRRLGPQAVGAIVGLPPQFYSASDGTAVSVMAMIPSGMGISAGWLPTLADSLEQMAKLLPDKG